MFTQTQNRPFAHLGPSVAAGLGTMLKLNTETIYQAIQQALHTTISTRQSRKGEISSWKAYAPAHAGKLAIEAVDRAIEVKALQVQYTKVRIVL